MLRSARLQPSSLEAASSPDGETGRRKRLKISRPQGHTGSIPVPGTNKNNELPLVLPSHQFASQFLLAVCLPFAGCLACICNALASLPLLLHRYSNVLAIYRNAYRPLAFELSFSTNMFRFCSSALSRMERCHVECNSWCLRESCVEAQYSSLLETRSRAIQATI
jgi:hypothetical protein